MIALPIAKRCETLASGRVAMGAEHDHLAVAFELHMQEQSFEDLQRDREKKTLLCKHVASNLDCDHVEVCVTPGGGSIVEIQAVGFVHEDHARDAVRKVLSGDVVHQDVWGASKVLGGPQHKTKQHRASRWLQLQRESSGELDVCRRSSSQSTDASATTLVGALESQESKESLESLRTVRRTVSFAPSPCNSTVEITPYSQTYCSDSSVQESPQNESCVPDYEHQQGDPCGSDFHTIIPSTTSTKVDMTTSPVVAAPSLSSAPQWFLGCRGLIEALPIASSRLFSGIFSGCTSPRQY
jgi:hypothetical protein